MAFISATVAERNGLRFCLINRGKGDAMVKCGRCGRDSIDSNFMEAFDGWNWFYVCGRGEIGACIKRAKERESYLLENPSQ